MSTTVSILVPSALVFGAIAAAGWAVFSPTSANPSTKLRHRIMPPSSSTGRSPATLTSRLSRQLRQSARRFDHLDRRSRLTEHLEAAGMKISAGEYLVIALAIALGASALAGALVNPTAGALAVVISSTTVAWYPRRRAERRRSEFRLALPGTLSLLAGALGAGHALSSAVDVVSREATGVVGAEWRRAVLESRVGVDLADSLSDVGERMKCAEMRWCVLVMQVNREVGGDLGAILRTVAATMRMREQQQRRIHALTAEGRLSAAVLALLPMIFAAYMAVVRPDYLSLLVTTPLGLLMTAMAITLLSAGVWWMRLLVRIDR